MQARASSSPALPLLSSSRFDFFFRIFVSNILTSFNKLFICKYLSVEIAAWHPLPAAVMACRHSLSCTSPAEKTPSTEVDVLSWSLTWDEPPLVGAELRVEKLCIRPVTDAVEHAGNFQRLRDGFVRFCVYEFETF